MKTKQIQKLCEKCNHTHDLIFIGQVNLCQKLGCLCIKWNAQYVKIQMQKKWIVWMGCVKVVYWGYLVELYYYCKTCTIIYRSY